MFCRILSLRYLWQSCKQLYVAMCLHNLIKRTLITLMPHLEHKPSLLHRDPLQLLSNLTIQFSCFSPSTSWSAASVSKKPHPIHYTEHSFLSDPSGAGQRCENSFISHIICGCWDLSPGKEGTHAACLKIVVWVLQSELGVLQEHPLACRGTGVWHWSVFTTSKERMLSFSGRFLSPSTLFSLKAIILFKANGVFSWGRG